MTNKADSDEKLTFEAAMLELERLVDKMEAGDLSLEQSLHAFERGVVLTRLCQRELQQAELKVQQLNSDGELEAFDISTADDA